MCELTIITVPFQVTAFLYTALAVAASIGLSYLIVTVVLNRIAEPVFPLPSGITAVCNSEGCKNPATRGLKEVADALTDKGEYIYVSGEKPEVYCDKHRARFGDRHPIIRILVTALLWVCLVWGVLAISRLG
jgi:hypothetical protein